MTKRKKPPPICWADPLPCQCGPCVDCLQMDEPPKIKRPVYDHKKRAARCYSHYIVVRDQRRAAAKVSSRKRRYGLDAQDFTDLLWWQGGTCPCGRRPKHHDHNHKIAREQCDHEESKACKRCMRGLLCYGCNVDILGHGYTSTMLRALADYYDNPPAPALFMINDLLDEEAS